MCKQCLALRCIHNNIIKEKKVKFDNGENKNVSIALDNLHTLSQTHKLTFWRPPSNLLLFSGLSLDSWGWAYCWVRWQEEPWSWTGRAGSWWWSRLHLQLWNQTDCLLTDMIGRNKVVVVMSKDPKLHTKVHVKQQTCPLDQRLTFALVLRWRLWLCFPLCRHSAAGNCVSSLGRTGGPGLLLRRGQRKKRTTRKRRRRCRRRWGQGGSWAPDSCSHCCCSHWHSLCYPRGQNHCCRLSLPHLHPAARRGSCSCQLCAALVQPVKKCTHCHFPLFNL